MGSQYGSTRSGEDLVLGRCIGQPEGIYLEGVGLSLDIGAMENAIL